MGRSVEFEVSGVRGVSGSAAELNQGADSELPVRWISRFLEFGLPDPVD